MRREKSNYIIQSVSHALDVLEQFCGEADELGVTELSKRLKLHKNNVFRLLATLESRGYIEQNKATENYRLGIRCLQLGQSYVAAHGPAAAGASDHGRPGAPGAGDASTWRSCGATRVVPVEVRRGRPSGAHRRRRSASRCRSTARPPARCTSPSSPTTT